MATEQQKTTYTAAEVAVLEETILKQKAKIDESKRRLEHMNEVFANAQSITECQYEIVIIEGIRINLWTIKFQCVISSLIS